MHSEYVKTLSICIKTAHLGVTLKENQLPLSEQNASNFLYQMWFAVSQEVGL